MKSFSSAGFRAACLSFMVFAVSCKPGGTGFAFGRHVFSEQEMITKFQVIDDRVDEASKALSTVNDVASCRAALESVGTCFDEWQVFVATLGDAKMKDPDHNVMTHARATGVKIGTNYVDALRISGPYLDDPEVAAALEKVKAGFKQMTHKES